MRSPDAIDARLQSEPEIHNRVILSRALDNPNVEHLALHLSETYEKAFLNALRHRPNGKHVDQFSTFTWLMGSDLNVADTPWLQFGMPRIRRLAKELNLPWIPIGNEETKLKAKRMSNGLSCQERCFLCFGGR